LLVQGGGSHCEVHSGDSCLEHCCGTDHRSLHTSSVQDHSYTGDEGRFALDAHHLRYRCRILVHTRRDAVELANDAGKRGDVWAHCRDRYHEAPVSLIEIQLVAWRCGFVITRAANLLRCQWPPGMFKCNTRHGDWFARRHIARQAEFDSWSVKVDQDAETGERLRHRLARSRHVLRTPNKTPSRLTA